MKSIILFINILFILSFVSCKKSINEKTNIGDTSRGNIFTTYNIQDLLKKTDTDNISSEKKFKNVKQVTVKEFWYKFGHKSESGILLEKISFDDNGNITIEENYLYKEEKSNNDSKEIDNLKNRLDLKRKEKIPKQYITNIKKQKFIYNKLGDKIREECYYNDKLKYEINYLYDTLQNMVEEKSKKYNMKGVPISRDVYTSLKYKKKYRYDGTGGLKEVLYYSKGGNLESKEKYNVDTMKLRLDIISVQKNNKEDILNSYFFDNNARLIKHDNVIYKYDNKNNIIEECYINDYNKKLWKIIYEYNENNDIIKYTEYNNDGSIKYNFKYSYNYDKYGNIFEKIYYDKLNEPYKLIRYDYEYNE